MKECPEPYPTSLSASVSPYLEWLHMLSVMQHRVPIWQTQVHPLLVCLQLVNKAPQVVAASLPNGPSMDTIDPPGYRTFFFAGAGRTEKFTSGGIESGARPIWDEWEDDAENDREDAGKAGTRKEGSDIDGPRLIALPRTFERAVENMARCRLRYHWIQDSVNLDGSWSRVNTQAKRL